MVGGLVALVLLAGGAWAAIRFFGGGSSSLLGGPGPSPTDVGEPGSSSVQRQVVPGTKTTLVYWGLWEPDQALRDVLDKFEEANPGVEVEYVMHNPRDYRERLQTAVAGGSGPDIFRFHASWTPMLSRELDPMPGSVMSAAQFEQAFYPVVRQQLVLDGRVMGVPLMYDGIGLYYNKDALAAADASPPRTWADLKALAARLTIRDGSAVTRAGVALGNADNVDHFAEVIGLLMLQNGADPANPNTREGQEALRFYTNFVTQDNVWSDQLPSSTVAFARGDAAMMLAPSWRVHQIIATNPDLNFGIVPAPRLGDRPIGWATYWAEGVNAFSDNKTEAWKLVKFLSSAETMQRLFSEQSQIRSFGEPYSRVELADNLAANELVEPFLSDAPFAQGWFLNSATHDNGINDQLIRYYRDAVNAVIGGSSASQAMTTVEDGTAQVLRQYGAE